MRLPAGVLFSPLALAVVLACSGPAAVPGEEAEGEPSALELQEAGASEDTASTSAPYRVEDSVPGRLSAGPVELTDVNGTLFFAATDAAHGSELWKSDGTPGGTRIVEDIRPGPAGASLRGLMAAGRRVYFTADDGTHGLELWTSNGTRAGTRLVRDIAAGDASSYPHALAALEGVLYFTAYSPELGFSQLWRTEGVPGTTRVVPTGLAFPPTELVPMGDQLYFFGGDRFQRLDGRTGAIVTLLDFTDRVDVYTVGPVVAEGVLYFIIGQSPIIGETGEDGTLQEGPRLFTVWKSDGTPEGTVAVADIHALLSFDGPNTLATAGRRLFFTADDGRVGAELWTSDGTCEGTRRVKDLLPGPDSPHIRSLTALGGAVYFSAYTPDAGDELWRSDGSPRGTFRLKDVMPGPAGSSIAQLTAQGGRLFFTAREQGRGHEPWTSDGTPRGTARIADAVPGAFSSAPHDFTRSGSRVYFAATEPARGTELWALRLVRSGGVELAAAVAVFPETGEGAALEREQGDRSRAPGAGPAYLVQDIIPGPDDPASARARAWAARSSSRRMTRASAPSCGRRAARRQAPGSSRTSARGRTAPGPGA
ncbi:ELWxxDGT repeat protein [Corallococcus sp. 4LFB]|uniref:ELWxxDGT repeat protein n=1 Tax=Corallococcus sp. 4LFB TaxID=3383249 RepID=UPI00397493AE